MPAGEFTIRRKVFQLFGASFHIYNAKGDVIGFSKQKAFKLKEDIRIFVDEEMTKERVAIKARKVLDFSSAYDVYDSRSGEKLGVLVRKGLKSILRDSWIMHDEQEVQIGEIQEDSMLLALVRRFLFKFLPQHYHLQDESGTELARFHRHFNPFVQRLTVHVNEEYTYDPYLLLSAGVLLVAIEGRQD